MSEPRLDDYSLRAYAAAAAAEQPAPGGGSVAAAAGALAAAMAAMSARYTAGRRKYAAVAAEIAALIARADAALGTLLEAVDADARAFTAVGTAYALPKDDPSRAAAIASASRAAAATPLAVLRTVGEVLSELPRLAEIGNINLASDTGVAAELARAAVAAAAMNVAVNWAGMDAPETVEAQREECAEAVRRADRLLSEVRTRLAGRHAGLGWVLTQPEA